MVRPIVAGNWKMNTTLDEALALVSELEKSIGALDDVERVLIPPFPWIVSVSNALRGSTIRVGAQDCYSEPSGAFTGEVSADMLAPYCRYVIVGHSERRHVIGEPDDLIAKKLRAAHRAGMTPILCVGETLDERESGQASAVVSRQLTTALEGLNVERVSNLVIAYEPVWAIGTGRAAEPDDAQEMARHVRREVAALANDSVAESIPIQYGGSVKAANAGAFLSLPDINGALVGGASLDAGEFREITRQAS